MKEIKLEQKENIVNYTPSERENSNITYIKTRFNEMSTHRRMVDKNWWLYNKMIEAAYTSYWDERSSSVVPLASSLIELFVAEAKKLQTEYHFKSEKNKDKAKAIEYAWKYDFRRHKRRKVFSKDEYNAAWYGTSFIYVWAEQKRYTSNDPIFIENTGEYNFIQKEITETNILVKNLDIRYVFIDNRATSIDDASDAIYIQYISKDKLRQISKSKLYKNIDSIPESYTKDTEAFYIKDIDDLNWKYIKLVHYWNVEKDYYCIIANDKVIIREHHIISTADWRKAIPIVMRWFGYKEWLYYRWICEAVMTFNSEINSFREMLMDAVRRSNNQTLLIWNWLSFNWREFSYNNEILKYTWQLNWNFQQISWNPPNQAIFNYLDRLYKDIAVYVWIDIQNIMWTPSQTAFQTEVQREASQKRINIWLENRDLAYERFADLYKDALQTYFIATLWENPEIEIEWWEFNEQGKFRQIKWKSIFKVTPEILRWQIDIDVYTNTTAPTINAVDRAQKLELINSIAQFTNWYLVAKQAWEDIESILPFKKTLEELAEDFNLTVEQNADEWDLKQKKQEFVAKLNAMKWWMIPQWVPEEQNLETNQAPLWV